MSDDSALNSAVYGGMSDASAPQYSASNYGVPSASADPAGPSDDFEQSDDTRSWFGPQQRRAGMGAARRNQVFRRQVEYVQSTGGSSEDSSEDSDDSDDTGSSTVTNSSSEKSLQDELLAVLLRLWRQMLRRKLMLLLQIVLPLVFVAIAIILWAIWGSEVRPENQPVSYSAGNLPGYVDSRITRLGDILFCYVPDPEAVPPPTLGSLPICLESPPYPTVYGNESIEFFCVPGGVYEGVDTIFPDSVIFCINQPVIASTFALLQDNSTRTPSDSFYLVLLNYFELVVRRALVPVHTLDTIIAYQWAFTSYLIRDAAPSYNEPGNGALTGQLAPVLSGMASPTRHSALYSSGRLYFVGSDRALLNGLEAYCNGVSGLFQYVYGGAYGTLDAAKAASAEASRGRNATERAWAYVEVKEMASSKLDVVIHVGNYALPSFSRTFDTGYSGGAQPDTADLYLASGFATLQKTVYDYYMETYIESGLNTSVFVAPMGSPEAKYVPILETARTILCLIFALAFLFHMSVHVKQHVLEKELRMREAMLIMGLRQWSLYVGNAIIEFIVLFLASVISVIMLKVTFVVRSDALIVFLVYFLFVLTIIPLGGLIASLFSQARLAALVAPVVYFIMVIPMFATVNASAAFITGFSIFSPTAFAAAMLLILQHEAGGGFDSHDFQSPLDGPRMAVLLGMMTADIVIYYLLMLYLDAVLPKEWGTSKHPLFFIVDPIRHCCCGKAKRLEGGPDGCDSNGVFEDLDHSRDVVVIDGLRKEYKRDGKSFVAVNNLYWGMCESEISVLLGHNGAGKTTVMNMMTGMIEPDEGDCYIYGNSVRQELSAVRQDLGFCPQHNILWPELTCRDHLEFFAQIKGLKGEALEDAVCRVLYETDMLDKIDVASGSLSGGMKRKLSIAIAFVGGSRLVFLDEPTAGLDVAARRHTWELLKRMSISRTILLTTHYMDEADLLGRRIGIMSQGRLKCSGSGLFLKSQIGVGYSIMISADPETDPAVVDNLVKDTVKGSVPLSRNGCELSYQLPKASANTFPDLLGELDEQGTALGVRGYSLTATTLEEVFLLVSDEDGAGNAVADDAVEQVWTSEFRNHRLPVQFRTMFRKRFWNALRDRRMQCFQIVCPVVCVLIAMLLGLIQFGQNTSIVYSYDMFTKFPTEPVIDVAQCRDHFGADFSVKGAVVNDTRFANAQFLSLYDLDTWFEHSAERLGAMQCSDWDLYEFCASAGFSEYSALTRSPSVLLYNTSSKHQVPIDLGVYYTKFAERVSGRTVDLKVSASLVSGKATIDGVSFIFLGALIMIPFAFLPSNPVAWVVKERECGARHQQTIAGLSYVVYWICNFVFDLCAYLIAMFLVIAIFAIFQRKEFIGPDVAGPVIVLFIVYGFTSTAAAYALSFLFNEHSSAQTTVMGMSFVAGFLLLVVVMVLQLNTDTQSAADTLKWVFRVVPPYCIGEGIFNLQTLDNRIAAGRATSAWDLDELGWLMIYMAAEFPVLCVLTMFFDAPWLWRCWERRRYDRDLDPEISADEDSDVEDERKAVYEAGDVEDSSDMVRVVDLQKRYGSGKKAKLAVKGISFSIFPGEVFGFLGTNGAGKTTTISILCQQFLPSGGEGSVCGYDVVSDYQDALANIGYCPQFDATLDLLTVEEHLRLYADLRGLTKADRETTVEALIDLCELSEYRKALASKLSGGNRRKLSTAISLVGGPRVVFLDEPTAGMDPVARRGLWTSIQKASQFCSVVLTTHHLEEVEALADIVAIMVDGSLKCIGDKVHLKNKYGSGYEVSIRVASGEYGGALQDFMQDSFPGSVLNESDDRRFVFQVPGRYTFADVFASLQDDKHDLRVTDYSVSQTSIEQIFLQMSEKGKHKG